MGCCRRVATLLLLGAQAQAQPAEIDPEARRLFDEGRALMEAGDHAGACPKLAESQRIDPGGGTLLNLALCNARLGRTATALAQFEEAERWAVRDGRDDRAAFARTELDALRPRISRLRIEVPESTRAPGLVVRRNGVELDPGSWGWAEPVDPGEQVIDAEAPGKVPARAVVHVGEEGDLRVFTLQALAGEVAPLPAREPVAAAPARPAPTPATAPQVDERGWPAQRVTGAVLAGGGLVALGVGTWFGLRAIALDRESDQACPGYDAANGTSGNGCDPAAFATSQAAVTAGWLATGFVVGGVVFAGTGAYLFFTAEDGARVRVGGTF
jgi:hypothetical protein